MKNNVKQTLLITALSLGIVVLSIVVSLFAFINGGIKEFSEADDLLSIYEETSYDYILKNPSSQQIEEYKKNPAIKKVVPFYQVVYTFNIKNENIELTLESLDDIKDIEFTKFSLNRLINENKLEENKIYLDYALGKKLGLKIGDEFGEEAMKFIVGGFYESHNTQLAFIPGLKKLIKTSISYSGVYISVENETEFYNSVVKNYQPLATLKERESFSSDEAYETYLKEFNSRDFSAYITEKKTGYLEAQESYKNKMNDANSSFLMAGIISGIIVLVGIISLSIAFLKNIKYEIVDGARKQVMFRYIISALIALICVIVVWLISIVSIASKQLHYVSTGKLISTGSMSIIIPAIGIFIAMGINLIIVQVKKDK